MSATLDWIKKMDNIATSKGMAEMVAPKAKVANNAIMAEAEEWQLEGNAEDNKLEQDALVETLRTISMMFGNVDEF